MNVRFRLLIITLILAFCGIAHASERRTADFGADVLQSIITPDGKNLWTSSITGELFIHSLEDNGNTLLHSGDMAYFMTRSNRGDLYAVSFGSLVVRLYRADGTLIQTLPNPDPALVHSLSFSPNGRLLATASNQYYPIRIWDIATGEVVREFPGSFNAARLQFLPNGLLMEGASTGINSGILRIWNPRTGRLVRTWPVAGAIWNVATSADGHRLAVVAGDVSSSGGDSEVTVWKPNGRLVTTISPSSVMAMTAAFRKDGTLLIGDLNSTVRFYNRRYRIVETVEAVSNTARRVDQLTFDRSGRRLAINVRSWQVTIWDR